MELQLFEQFIAEALAMIPQKIREKMVNIAFLVEAGQPTGSLLGLYHGIPITRRVHQAYSGVLPDTITIFQAPIEKQAGSEPEAIRQLVHQVVHHEVGHYFGFSEAKVRSWEKNRKKPLIDNSGKIFDYTSQRPRPVEYQQEENQQANHRRQDAGDQKQKRFDDED